MKIDAINQKHAGYLERYVKNIQGIMFDATERARIGKFSEINDLLSNVIRYSNTFKQYRQMYLNTGFKEYTKNPNEVNEWCYMIPNLMMYASTGFLIGIRNNNNTEDINIAIDRLFEKTVDMTSRTNKMLDELEELGKLEKLLTNVINK